MGDYARDLERSAVVDEARKAVEIEHAYAERAAQLEGRVRDTADALSQALQAGGGSTAQIEHLGSDYRHACAAARPDQNWWTGWSSAPAQGEEGRAR